MRRPVPHSRPLLGKPEERAAARVIRSRHLAAGREVEAFAAELAARFGRRYAVPTASGLAALHLCLEALGAKGRAVQVPSYVCSALLNAVDAAGARPALVDTPLFGFLADPSCGGTTAGVAVYPQLLGVVAGLAPRPGVRVVEDCAMALGPRALRQGVASVASFYATKMMATAQGGAVLTDDRGLFDEIRDLMDYDNRDAWRRRFNCGLTDLAAAVGRAQLRRLDGFLARRRELCRRYDREIGRRRPDLLAFPGGLAARFPDEALFRYWIRPADVEAARLSLAARGVEAKRPVYLPLHRYLGRPDRAFPHATRAWESFLSIPFHPSLTRAEEDRVLRAVAAL